MSDERKNLFYFATKELSQDAFLRWLFENYKDPQLSGAVGALLKEFCGIDITNVKEITTEAQWCHTDIRIDILCDDEKGYVLFIEDKTYSSEHKQLKKYDSEFTKYLSKDFKEKHSSREVTALFKIYYKTSEIEKGEKERIKRANTENDKCQVHLYRQAKWKEYNLERILEIFRCREKSGNTLLDQYIEHLEMLSEARKSKGKPSAHRVWVDYLRWQSYFEDIQKKVISKVSNVQNDAGGVWKAGRFPYMCMVFKRKQNEPYLEIRSRDCLGDTFTARILCYGMDKEWDDELNEERDPNKQEKIYIDEKIKRNEMLINDLKNETSFFKVSNKGKPSKEFKKQIAIYEKNNFSMNDESFVDEIRKCVEEFAILMTKWDESMESSAN